MKKIIIGLNIIISLMLSNDILIDVKKENLLKKEYYEKIDLEQRRIIEEMLVNKYEWVSSLNVKANSKFNENENGDNSLNISIDQKIYNFGGIEEQIQYALTFNKLSSLKLDNEIKNYIYLMNDNKISYEISKLNKSKAVLQVNNSEIEVDINKDKYKIGEIDLSTLNQSLITLQANKSQLVGYKLDLLLYKNNFKILSDLDIDKYIIYKDLLFLNKDKYMENNMDLKIQKQTENLSKNEYNLLKSDFMPSLSIVSSYNIDNDNVKENEFYVGAAITLKIDPLFKSKLENKKIEYLKNINNNNIKIIEKNINYDNLVFTLDEINSQIKLTINNIKLYQDLYEFNKIEKEAGFKIESEVESFYNSVNIQKIELDILNLTKMKNMNNYLNN